MADAPASHSLSGWSDPDEHAMTGNMQMKSCNYVMCKGTSHPQMNLLKSLAANGLVTETWLGENPRWNKAKIWTQLSPVNSDQPACSNFAPKTWDRQKNRTGANTAEECFEVNFLIVIVNCAFILLSFLQALKIFEICDILGCIDSVVELTIHLFGIHARARALIRKRGLSYENAVSHTKTRSGGRARAAIHIQTNNIEGLSDVRYAYHRYWHR